MVIILGKKGLLVVFEISIKILIKDLLDAILQLVLGFCSQKSGLGSVTLDGALSDRFPSRCPAPEAAVVASSPTMCMICANPRMGFVAYRDDATTCLWPSLAHTLNRLDLGLARPLPQTVVVASS